MSGYCEVFASPSAIDAGTTGLVVTGEFEMGDVAGGNSPPVLQLVFSFSATGSFE